MSGLAESIRQKLAELVEAEARVVELRAEIQEAKQALFEGPSGIIVAHASGLRASSGNSTEWAEAVLLKAKEPMHVNSIISAIERDYGVSVRYATLVGNLSRLVKKNKTFERVGPNVFGLAQWSTELDFEREYARLEAEQQEG